MINIVKNLQKKYKFITQIEETSDNTTIYIEYDNIKEIVKYLKEHYEFNMLIDLTVVDYLEYIKEYKNRYYVVYILRDYRDKNKLLTIKMGVDTPSLEIDSITSLYNSADWLEREAYDQYGIIFKGHHNLKRILNHHEFEGHPLRKDYNITDYQLCTTTQDLMDEMTPKLLHLPNVKAVCDVGAKSCELDTDLMFLNLGPSHPATHGTIRNLVAVDGEYIRACVSEIGYLHRGFEKSAENHTYNQIIPYTDRLNYCSAIMNNVGFAKAVEDMMGVVIPDRAIFIRVILSELSRIIDHLVCNSANFVDMGGLTSFWYLFNPREDAYNLLSKLTGARLTNSYTRIGGLSRDLYDGFENDLEDVLKSIEKGLDDTLSLVDNNKIFHDRAQNISIISKEDALSYGFSGVCLRASGVDYDIRKDNPYYYYDTFDFDTIVGSEGDVYDRIMVRFEEIRESIKIIRECMKKLPSGDIAVNNKEVFLPKKEDVYNSIEGMINHFKLIFDGITPPVGEYYSATEAANGELGFYIVSDGSGTPYKVKVRPPCFFMMSAYAKMVENHQIADAIINLGSLNIIAGELDR
jgi:NADH-quinone oxidoreductase subunit C/D